MTVPNGDVGDPVASLLRMSEQELANHVAGRDVRAYGAASMATLATVLAFLGLASRQAMGEKVPVLPGAGSTGGQIAWAAALGLMMLAAGWLARNVVMKRLQTTIVVSLLLHLLMCVVFQKLNVNFPLARVAQPEAGESSLSEVSLPDYGGMESIDAPVPDWDATTENAVTDARTEDVQRQMNEVEISDDLQQVEFERPQEIARTEEMQRQEVEIRQREMEAELQRRAAAQQAAATEAETTPRVETQAAAAAELQARAEARRSEDSLPAAQRERMVAETQSAPRVLAQEIPSRREEMTPEQRDVEAARRQARAAQAVEATANSIESIELATADAAEAVTRERETELQRQSQTSLSQMQRRTDEAPATSRVVNVENTAAGRLAAAERLPANTAPVSGGAASQQRAVSGAAGALSALDSSAQSVEVASVAGADAPMLDASSSSVVATRGNTGRVPVGAAQTGGGVVSGASTSTMVAALGSGTIGRQASAGSGQPRLGDAVSSPVSGSTGRSGQRQPLAGGGTVAGEVAVAAAEASRASGNGVLATGPVSSVVGRAAPGVAATVSNRSGGGSASAAVPSAVRPTSVRSGSGTGTDDLASGGTSAPAVTLGRNAGLSAQGQSRLPAVRSTAAATLPPGAALAEQGGALVLAGPQAAVASSRGVLNSGGGLSGPRTTTVGRRTAGLPGTSRATTIGRSRAALPIASGGSTGLSRTPATGNVAPSLASTSEIAGLVKRAAPGAEAVQGGPISAGFSMRRPDIRREAVRKLGGNDASEQAVERGLKWLAGHQFAAGNWSIHELNCSDEGCTGHGSFQADTAATGLALLAFLGAGHSHRAGEYQPEVDRGIQWLLQNQKSNGDLYTDTSEFVWLYSHGMAAIALCEAYGMTRDPDLKEPAQRAVDFIVAAQHPEFGGWRYRPQFESDTSVSGWQLMALKSGQMAGLNVPKTAYEGVSKWLDSVEDRSSPGRFSYHPSKPDTLAMTAEGLLMRQYLGAGRLDTSLTAGAGFLKQRLPRLEERDAYYWYYATQVMFHMQGDYWFQWNGAIRDLLVNSQEKGGHVAGSWDPESPTRSKWGNAGGRHYVTCLNLLMLEVYYRHLPLYIELAE